MSGAAFHSAGEKVIDKAKAIAAHNLKVDVADVNFNEGLFSSAKTNQTMTIKDVAQDSFNPAKLPKDMEAASTPPRSTGGRGELSERRAHLRGRGRSGNRQDRQW
jgi:CO/xanthine dehydrogenase Mo-binding subunit